MVVIASTASAPPPDTTTTPTTHTAIITTTTTDTPTACPLRSRHTPAAPWLQARPLQLPRGASMSATVTVPPNQANWPRRRCRCCHRHLPYTTRVPTPYQPQRRTLHHNWTAWARPTTPPPRRASPTPPPMSLPPQPTKAELTTATGTTATITAAAAGDGVTTATDTGALAGDQTPCGG